ncbi:MAG: hypothetical protein ACTSPX_03495 [Candidatus Thorarchaeota archaeon]
MALVNQLLLTDRTKDDSSNPHLLDANVNDCFADDDYIYIATDGGLSVLNRSSLSRAGYHQLDKKVTSIWASASYVYYATWGGGLYRVSKADVNGDFSASATQFLHTGSTPSLPTDYLYKVRGHSDSAILIGHSKGVSFYNGSSVYSGYHLLADDFVDNNEGDDPAGWTVDENGSGAASVIADPFDSDEKCVKVTKPSGSDGAAVYRDFTAASKVVVVFEMTLTEISTDDNIGFTLREAGSPRLGVAFKLNGKLAYYNASGWQELNFDYELWRRYKFVIVADAGSDQWDLYIDGVKVLSQESAVAADNYDRAFFCTWAAGTLYVHNCYITDATSDTFWGGPSKAVAITSSEIYYSTGSGVARKDSYPTAGWETAPDFHYDEDSTPGLIKDLPGKFEVTDLAVAEDKSSQDNTHNKLVVGQRNGVTVIDEHSTPSSGVSTHYGRSDLTTSRQDKLAGYSDVVGAVAIDSEGSYLYVGTREDEDPSDNFEGTVLDSLRWKATEENNGSITQNNVVTISTTTDTNSYGCLRSRSKYLIVGDFDIQVEFENISGTDGSGDRVLARLGISDGRGYAATIQRDVSGVGNEYRFTCTGASSSYSNTSDVAGKLRLVREGVTIRGYYWSDGWVKLGSASLNGRPVYVYLETHAASSGIACSADYKNFKINKGTVIWLNGEPKCAYTKIKLADNSVQEFIEGLDAKALCM